MRFSVYRSLVCLAYTLPSVAINPLIYDVGCRGNSHFI